MSVSRVHVAGIGLSFSSQQDITNGAIDAGARALLDAGITYAKVQLSVACSLENSQASVPRECFKAFGRQKAPVCSMDSHSALHIVAQCIRTGQTDCAILVGLDKGSTDRSGDTAKIATVAVVLVSDRFLVAHAFLKDSAVQIRACSLTAAGRDVRSSVKAVLRHAGVKAGEIQLVEAHGSSPTDDRSELLHNTEANQASRPQEPLKGFDTTGLAGLCGIVWRLRGWFPKHNTRLQTCLQHTSTREGQALTVVLCRSDGQAAPGYQDVQNLRDGRERLGYNPAEEMTKDIGWRMEGVKSREGDRMPVTEAGELRLTTRGGDRAALARL